MAYPGFHGPSQPEAPARGLVVPVVYEQAKAAPARFAYRLITVDPRHDEPLNEGRLNALGDDGWLLIAVLRGQATGDTGRMDYLFVRAKTAGAERR